MQKVSELCEDFAKVESNYLHSPILNNILFGYRNGGVHHFDNRFFEPIGAENNIDEITWNDLTENNEFKTLDNGHGTGNLGKWHFNRKVPIFTNRVEQGQVKISC